MERLLIDGLGNYLFFCPIVLTINRWWGKPKIRNMYLLSSVPVALFSGRAFTWFLTDLWYPLWGVAL